MRAAARDTKREPGEFILAPEYRLKDAVMRRKYGIGLLDYDGLLGEQGGGCAICGGKPPKSRRLAVDHDHVTGKVRGLLCTSCNIGLGYFKEARNSLESAIAYLDRHEDFFGE